MKNDVGLLAAIRFESGQDIDALLEDIGNAQSKAGRNVRGVLQSRANSSGECHCTDMDLHTIGSDQTFRISQSLGSGSAGCRLHPGALAQCAVHLQTEVECRCDLLILNRFGKGESEGRGFRDLISFAMTSQISILTSIRGTYEPAFKAFAGEFGFILPFEKHAVEDWLETVKQVRAA